MQVGHVADPVARRVRLQSTISAAANALRTACNRSRVPNSSPRPVSVHRVEWVIPVLRILRVQSDPHGFHIGQPRVRRRELWSVLSTGSGQNREQDNNQEHDGRAA